jgi:hypothetical protein
MSFATVLSALGIGGTTAAGAGAGAAATAGTSASLGSTLGSIGNAAQSVLGTSALNSAGTGLATGGSQGGLLGSLQSMSGGTGGGGSSGGEGGGMSDPAMGVLKMIFGGPPPAQAIPDTASTIAGLKQQTDAGKQLNTPRVSAANSSGFMSGLLEPFMTNGEYDATKTGGIVGSMLGGMLQSDGGIPQAPEINFGDISLPKTNQSFDNRPWVDDEISSYLAQLLGG